MSVGSMDWFERITGFREIDYDSTRSHLSIQDGRLVSQRSDRRWAIGELETPTLDELRERARALIIGSGPTRLQCIAADVRKLHGYPENVGALFQVASQFNLLEMVGPNVTPEHGVTRYQHDQTQGPACAMAAGAATIYRNYFAPVAGSTGQCDEFQIDCLCDLGRELGNKDGQLWQMRNGYALCSKEGLTQIDRHLEFIDESDRDALRSKLRIGLHWNVDVTDLEQPGHRVSQAFCSALPVAYSDFHARRWHRFASLVLEAAYEATLLAALINRHDTGNSVVFLTRLGGGAFGNDPEWIHAAIRRAVLAVQDAALDIRLVTYGSVSPDLRRFAASFS